MVNGKPKPKAIQIPIMYAKMQFPVTSSSEWSMSFFVDSYFSVSRVSTVLSEIPSMFKAMHYIRQSTCSVNEWFFVAQGITDFAKFELVWILCEFIENFIGIYRDLMCFLRMHSKQTCSYSNESSSSEIGEETRDNLKNNHSLNEKLSKKPENPTNLFLYMQMELCDKGTLRDIIDNEQLYHKPTRYWEMLRQMTAGLGYLHLQNICHRDLKPRNVMISTDNKIKLGDFGLATENSSRIVEKDQNIGENGKFEDKNMSVGNSISDFAFDFEKSEALDFESEKTKNVGTMLYIAPEIRITGKYTDKVDMYSLGICFYIGLNMKHILLGFQGFACLPLSIILMQNHF